MCWYFVLVCVMVSFVLVLLSSSSMFLCFIVWVLVMCILVIGLVISGVICVVLVVM